MYINRKVVDSQDTMRLSEELGITPELAMVLLKRYDTIDVSELRNYLFADSVLYVPFPHVSEAVSLLNKHILAGCKIAIINDYDVDGITSGLIASEMLRFLGVETTIITSDRITGGYSITNDLIDEAKAFDASLIITTDNGITAFEPIAYAKELGIDVLITDHHEPIIENGSEELPDAEVIVEPKLSDCNYPMQEICGAVVVFKVAEALLSAQNLELLGMAHLAPAADGLLGGFSELAGIATIMDVMPLVGENRVIVKNALKRINNGSYFVGIRQLAALMNIELGKITSKRISFGIGPCLNAESRMTGKIETCLKLLQTKDNNEAEKLARSLIAINDKRKDKTAKLEEEYLPQAVASDDNFIFVYVQNELHTLCGILAGRIVEKTSKPCVVLTDNPNGTLTGSGRAPKGYNIIENLRKYNDLFDKLGGHEGACGLTISRDNFETLKDVLRKDSSIAAGAKGNDYVDIYINPCFVRNAFLDELYLLEPYGEDNEELCIMAESCILVSMKPLGKTGLYRTFQLMDNRGNLFEAKLFSSVSEMESRFVSDFGEDALQTLKLGRGNFKVDLVYEPRYNTWNGVTEIQFMMKDYQKSMK